MVRTFVTVASAAGVADAARELMYSESTVLYHVRELEKAWQVPLFVRGGGRMRLSAHGRAALEPARQLLRMADHLQSTAAGGTAALAGRCGGRVPPGRRVRGPGPAAGRPAAATPPQRSLGARG